MRRIAALPVLLICLFSLAACEKEREDRSNIYSVYYVSNSETKTD